MKRRTIVGILSLILVSVTACSPSSTIPPPDRPPAPTYTPTPEPQVDTPAWFDDAILYEVFVRSFHDSDGDGIGDLPGLTSRLDYLQDLGVTAVWLMPIHPSPSYHGYDVTDYFAINPDYGSLGDVIAFVDEAHARGIRVIIDLVVNHTSDDHPIFQEAFANPESRYADWFLWTNESHTTYQAFGGFKDMPRLKHEHPEVLAYTLDVARFWMDLDDDGDYSDGVDGFRCDVAKDVPLSTWQVLKREMREIKPESLLLGEVWEGNAQRLIKWYDDAFDALFDYPLYHAIAKDHDTNLDSVLAGVQDPDLIDMFIIGQQNLFPSGYQVLRFVNNHDTNRIMSEVGGDWARARVAATLLLTLPGTPMIYYGEEIGMKGEKGDGTPYWDEFRREPMDWYESEEGAGMTNWFKASQRFNAPHDGISVEEQLGDDASLWTHYQSLIGLRKAHRALRTGAFGKVQVDGAEKVYAYTRHAPPAGEQLEEWFLIVLNFSDEPQTPSLALNLTYPGPFEATDVLDEEPWPDLPADDVYRVELAPTSGAVLRLNPPIDRHSQAQAQAQGAQRASYEK
ncbi:MAG TPA: DUF3459 domain-containing protein [Chloroflexi bacterium]|nr:DUF3459 domain-containing protein [Chloroflexota bacterium]